MVSSLCYLRALSIRTKRLLRLIVSVKDETAAKGPGFQASLHCRKVDEGRIKKLVQASISNFMGTISLIPPFSTASV